MTRIKAGPLNTISARARRPRFAGMPRSRPTPTLSPPINMKSWPESSGGSTDFMRRGLAALFVTAAALLPLAKAQTDTASLTGVVSDASGALIQHAVVKITNQGTGITVAAHSNENGFYF